MTVNDLAAEVKADPRYTQALRNMQQGQWEEAAEALAALEDAYAACDALRPLQQMLALRLSVEESWSAEQRRLESSLWYRGRRLAASARRVPAVRMLSLANLLVYLGLGVLWLLAR